VTSLASDAFFLGGFAFLFLPFTRLLVKPFLGSALLVLLPNYYANDAQDDEEAVEVEEH